VRWGMVKKIIETSAEVSIIILCKLIVHQ
jgi:hypothetical protein